MDAAVTPSHSPRSQGFPSQTTCGCARSLSLRFRLFVATAIHLPHPIFMPLID